MLAEPGARFPGAEYAGVMQGMMALWETGHTARLPAVYGKPLVYVDYLEAAPWNLRLLNHTPRYRSVGYRLIEQAVLLSAGLGFDGCIGLVALPQAEEFYERVCGMTAVGQDPRYNGLMCYELTAAQAERFLRRG